MAIKLKDQELGLEAISASKEKNMADRKTANPSSSSSASALNAERQTTRKKAVQTEAKSAAAHGGSSGSFGSGAAAGAAQKKNTTTGRRIVDVADLPRDLLDFAARTGSRIDVGSDALLVDTTGRRREIAGLRRANDVQTARNNRTIANYRGTLQTLAARLGLYDPSRGDEDPDRLDEILTRVSMGDLHVPDSEENRKTLAQIDRIRGKIRGLNDQNAALQAKTNDALSELSFLKISASGDADTFEQLYKLGYEQQGNRAATWAESQTGGLAFAAQSAAGRSAQTEKQISALRQRLRNAGYSDAELDGALKDYKHYRNLQEKAAVQEGVTDWMRKSPLNAAIANVGSAAAAPVRNVMNVLKIADGDSASRYDLLGQISEAVQTVTRADVEAAVDRGTGNRWLARAAGMAYAGGVSAVESMITMAVGGKLGEAIMGLGAAGDAYGDALDRGMSQGQALINATAAGAFETIFEHLSLENLRVLQAKPIDPASSTGRRILQGIVNTGKQVLTEGSEEVATDLANEVFDYLVNGGASRYATYLREQTAKNVSEAAAKKQYAKNLTASVMESFAVGGLSGGLSAGTVQTATGLSAAAENRAIGRATQAYAKTTEGGMRGLLGEMRETVDADSRAGRRLAAATEIDGSARTGAAVRSFLEEAAGENARSDSRTAALADARARIAEAARDASADLTPYLERIGLQPMQAQAVARSLRKLASGERMTNAEERTLAAQEETVARVYLETLEKELTSRDARETLIRNLSDGIRAAEDAGLRKKLGGIRDRMRKDADGQTAEAAETNPEAAGQTPDAGDAKTEAVGTQTEKTEAGTGTEPRSPLAAELLEPEAERRTQDPVYRETEERTETAARRSESWKAVHAAYPATDAAGNAVLAGGVLGTKNGRLQVVIDESGAATDADSLRFTGPDADEAAAVYATLAEMTAGRYLREDARLAGESGSYNAPLSADGANAALAYLAETPDADAESFLAEFYDAYTLGKTGLNVGYQERIRSEETTLPTDVTLAAYRLGRSERTYGRGVTRVGTTPISDALVYQLQAIDEWARGKNVAVVATDRLFTRSGTALLGTQQRRNVVLSLFRGATNEDGSRAERENLLELTAYHESVHLLREADEGAYGILHDMVMEELRTQLSAEEYRALYEQRAQIYGDDADLVEEEIVAQFLGTGKAWIRSGKAEARIRENPGAWEKFVGILKNVIAEIRAAIRRLAKTDRTAAAALRTEEKKLAKLVETYDALLEEATQARAETAAAGTEAKENPAGEGREKYLYGIPDDNVFPPYNESKSDANEWAMRWARLPDVKTGDWRLATYHDRWYIIEKFDTAPNKYLVMQYVKKKEFAYYRAIWEEQYGRKFKEELERLYSTISDYDRKTIRNREKRSDLYADVSEHPGENQKVFGLGEITHEGQQDRINSNEGFVGSDEDQSRDGAIAGRSVQSIEQYSVDLDAEAGTEVKENPAGEGREKYSYADFDKPITREDIQVLRKFFPKRKSVNAFTRQELEATAKWAYKYYRQMGVKSPFFRAWFGDWRAQDKNDVKIIDAKEIEPYKAGKAVNADTDVIISWGDHLKGETRSKYGKESDAYSYLRNIKGIVENAVLLDSSTSELSSKSKMENTTFMHSFYAVVTENGQQTILKLVAEEALNSTLTSDFVRGYELQKIEKVATLHTGIHSEEYSGGLTRQVTTIHTVSDLYAIVKQKDKNFVPGRNISPLMLNEDGTPKVFYHGSPAEFRAFDKKKSRGSNLYGRGFYFTESENHGKQYGNLYSVYLNLAHPLTPGGDVVTREQVRAFLSEIASEENEDYDLDNYGYGKTVEDILNEVYREDAFDVIQDINATAIGDFVAAVELFNKVNGTDFDGIRTDTETVAFYPNQIKSAETGTARENIGTFSRFDDEMRYSVDLEAEAEERLEQEAEGDTRLLEAQDVLREEVSEAVYKAEKEKTVFPKIGEIKRITDKYSPDKSQQFALTTKKMLRNLYEGRVSYASFMKDLTNAMRSEIAKTGHWEELEDPVGKKWRKENRNRGLYLPSEALSEVADYYGGKQALRRATFGKINLTDDKSKGYEDLSVFFQRSFEAGAVYLEFTEPIAQVQEVLRRMQDKDKIWIDDDKNNQLLGTTDRQWARDNAMSMLAELLRLQSAKKSEVKLQGISVLRDVLQMERDNETRKVIEAAEKKADEDLAKEALRMVEDEETDTVSAEAFVAEQQKSRRLEARMRAMLDNARRREAEAERRHAAEKEAEQLRGQIRRGVRRIDRMLRQNANTENVPEELKRTVLGLLRMFAADRGVFSAKELEQVRFDYGRIQAGIENGEDGYEHKVALDRLDEEAMEALNRMLDDLKARRALTWKEPRPYRGEEASHHKARVEALRETFADVDAFYIRDLTLEEARIVANAVETISHYVRTAGEVVVGDRAARVEDLATALIREAKARSRNRRKLRATQFIDDYLTTYMLTPAYFFNEKIGGTMRRIFEPFWDAQDSWARRAKAGKDAIAAAKDKYNYKQWKKDEQVFTFTGFAADTDEVWRVKLPVEARLQLYALMQRERRSGQESSHLIPREGYDGKKRAGGVVLSDALQKEQKNLAKSKEAVAAQIHDHQNEAYKEFLREVDERTAAVADVERHLLNEEDLQMIEDSLTDEQKAYADEIVRFMSSETSGWGNETTLTQYGIRKFGEGYYFPYETPKQFNSRRYGLADDTRLKNWGSAKNTVRQATTPLVISGFTEVAAAHIQEMALYSSMLTPIETMTAVLNYNDRQKTGNVKTALEEAYGAAAEAYIADFLTAVNGGLRSDSMDNVFNRMTGKFKAAAVMANASVVVQQPTALLRATAMMNPKYFFGAARPADYRDMMEHCPTAIVKEMGGFDTAMGLSAAEWMVDEKTRAQKAADLAGKGAELGDAVTWTNLWNAVKRETRDRHPELAYGSDAYYDACNRRFREIANYTQVYDSVLSKSMLMRSKGALSRMVTAFMAEPTLSYNLLVMSGRDKSIRRSRAITAFLLNTVVNVLAQSLIGALRDKDEDETWLEKYLESVAGSLVGTKDVGFLNGAWDPLGLIPYAKDVFSIIEGYDVERADVSVISDLINSAGKIIKTIRQGDAPTWQQIGDLAAILTGFGPVPAKNLYKDLTRLAETIRIRVQHGWKNTGYTAADSLLEGLGMEPDDAEKAYFAVLHREDEVIRRMQDYGAKEIRALIKKGYSEEDALQKADDDAYKKWHGWLVDGLAACDARVLEAAVAFYEAHDYALYQEIVEQITRDGFIRNDVKAAVDREIEAMRPKESEADDRTEKPLFTKGSIRIPVEAGDKAGYLNMKRLLLDAGETEEDLNGEAQRAIRDQYKPGDINYDTAVDRLVTFAGYDRSDAQNKVEVWKIEGLTDTSLDDKVILGYVEKLKGSGIDFETFEAFYKAQAACEGEKDANGNTKRYSVQKQVVDIIKDLPISPAKKDALYLYKYKESGLDEAPWR